MMTAGLLCAAVVCAINCVLGLGNILDGQDSTKRFIGLVMLAVGAFAVTMCVITIRWINEVSSL